jgi:hypothetical protein
MRSKGRLGTFRRFSPSRPYPVALPHSSLKRRELTVSLRKDHRASALSKRRKGGDVPSASSATGSDEKKEKPMSEMSEAERKVAAGLKPHSLSRVFFFSHIWLRLLAGD